VSAGYAAIRALQAWIAIVLTGLATWLTMRDRGRRVPTLLYPALAGLAAVVGLIVVTSQGAWYRSIVVAAPAVVVLRKLDIRWQALILAVVGCRPESSRTASSRGHWPEFQLDESSVCSGERHLRSLTPQSETVQR
jgi:hypothetical protein